GEVGLGLVLGQARAEELPLGAKALGLLARLERLDPDPAGVVEREREERVEGEPPGLEDDALGETTLGFLVRARVGPRRATDERERETDDDAEPDRLHQRASA